MVTFTTKVMRVGFARLLPAKWSVAHSCNECREEVAGAELINHARDAHGEGLEDRCCLCGQPHEQDIDCRGLAGARPG